MFEMDLQSFGGRGTSYSGGRSRGTGKANSTLGPQGRPKTIDEALSSTNPHWSEGREWQTNCQRCVYTYEMARRGYDVEAMPRITNGVDVTAQHWRDIMDGQTWEKMPSRNTVVSMLNKMDDWGDGARAVVYVVWKGARSSHVFIAEQANGGGTYFVDPQTGNYVDIDHYMGMAIKGRTEISRIDNLTPSTRIEQCARRRK